MKKILVFALLCTMILGAAMAETAVENVPATMPCQMAENNTCPMGENCQMANGEGVCMMETCPQGEGECTCTGETEDECAMCAVCGIATTEEPVYMLPESDIRLIESSHPAYITDGPIRTAYAEFEYQPGDRFEITLEYTNTAVYHDPKESEATSDLPADVLPYLAEVEPHIVFTPYLKKLAAYLTAGTDNPLTKARRIYDYVTSHVR